MAGLVDDESAVADVIGNFLLIGITVAMVAVVAFFIASQPPPDNPVNADLVVRSGGNQLFIEHTWGEPVQLEGGRLLVTWEDASAGGAEETKAWPLAGSEVNEPPETNIADPDVGLEGFWELNERLCVSCMSEFGSDDVISAVGIVQSNNLAVNWGGSVTIP